MAALVKKRRIPRKRPPSEQEKATYNSAPCSGLLFQGDVSVQILEYLEQQTLCQLMSASQVHRDVVCCQSVWQRQELDLHRQPHGMAVTRGRDSADFAMLLKSRPSYLAWVGTVVLPKSSWEAVDDKRKCQKFKKAIAVAWPSLRCLDLSWWLPAASEGLLPFPNLEHLRLPGCLPRAPMPELRVLQLIGRVESGTNRGCIDFGNINTWRQLPKLLPRLEVLHAPWVDGPRDMDVRSETQWKVRMEQMLGRDAMSDACLEPLLEMKHLKELDLSGIHTLTDSGLNTLAQLPALQVLRLQNMGYCITSLQAFVTARANPLLIDLRNCMDTGFRPHRGRTALGPKHVSELKRQQPMVDVLFS